MELNEINLQSKDKTEGENSSVASVSIGDNFPLKKIWRFDISLEFLRQTLLRIKQQKINYTLGFFSCFIVVLVVGILLTITNEAPSIFLRLSELENGEIDIDFTATHGIQLLNYTLFESITESDVQFSYSSPRIIDTIQVTACTGLPSNLDPYDLSWKYLGTQPNEACTISDGNCFYQYCNDPFIFTANLFVIDSNREARMGLGREWNLPKLTLAGTAYVQAPLASALGLSQGNLIFIDVTGPSFYGTLWYDVVSNSTNSNNTLIYTEHIFAPVVIESIYPTALGKYANNITLAIVMEYDIIQSFLANNSHPEMNSESKNNLLQLNLYEYAQHIEANLPPPRLNAYLSSNYDVIQWNVVQFAANFMYKIGFDLVDTTLPVLNGVHSYVYFNLFLGLIVNVIIVILLLLSILLIYSLLMINVETRKFEMGVLRLLGTWRSGIIQLLLFQAFSYSLPSWVFGLIVAYGGTFIVVKIFQNLTGISISTGLSVDAILLATGLGIFIPIVASFFPIREALSKNLQDSLDISHSKTKAIKISINRSESTSFSCTFILVGILLAGFGFGVYYIFPLALLSLDLNLLLNMFFFLLLGMLLGLVLLSLNLEHLLERAIVRLFLFWERKAISKLVLKNLVAHRIRNRKTTIMYALSLGFIIFINVSFNVTIDSFIYSIQRNKGGFLRLEAPDGLNTSAPSRNGPASINQILPIAEIEHWALANPHIDSFSWISVPLQDLLGSGIASVFTNVGHAYESDPILVNSIPPNFLTTSLQQYVSISARQPMKNQFTVVEALYTVQGSGTLLLGSMFEQMLGLSTSTDVLLQITNSSFVFPTIYLDRLSPQALLNSFPGFSISEFDTKDVQASIVSFPSFVRLSQYTLDSVDSIPMQYFLISLSSDASNSDIDNMVAELNRIMAQSGVTVWDYRQAIGPINTASELMTYFFDFTIVVAMLICFFSLMASMYTNVHEQTKEIGILRALGINKFWIFRIYIFEAFVLVLSASILGIIIGTVIAWTMTIQRVLFTQLPVSFNFPYQIFGIVFLCAIVFSVLSSFGPIRSILQKPIVTIMRLLS